MPVASMRDEDWRIALRQVIEQLAKRNASHKKYSEIRDRTQEMDFMILELRQLLGKNEIEAAQLHVKCLSYIEETDRILKIKIPSYHSRSTSPCRVNPITDKHSIGWEDENLNENFYDANNQYYQQHKSRWWKILCLNSGKEAKDKQQTEGIRDLWNTQIEFFLSCVGFIVGVGNTLRFPSMIYQHGGGVFLIPYFICLFLFGLPLVYMHLCIGQYAGLSASGAFWKMMPLASGLGWALVLLAVPVSIYYNIIVAWSLYYFWYSVQGLFVSTGLPWVQCDKAWVQRFNCCDLHTEITCYDNPYSITSTEAFFHYQVLNRTLLASPTLGPVQSHIFIALAAAWIIVFFGVFKGIGSIGWAVTFTATVPYLLLVILLIRGLSLPGASTGINFFLSADMSRLWSLNIWKSAAEQVFYSLGIDAGPLISMASFSRYRNNIYRDAIILVVLDTFTSILCGLVIFSFIGFLSTIQHKDMTDILKHDSLYLPYTVYPGVPAYMEWGPLWAALFFAMLILSAIDAEFAWLEMIASSIMNQFGSKQKRLENRLLAIMCFCFFLAGIPFCCRGGIYIFHSIENLNANWNSFSLSLMQIIIVCYVYGVSNFLEDIGEMLRIAPKDSEVVVVPMLRYWNKFKRVFGPTGSYIKWTWCLFSPLILAALLLASVFRYERVRFNEKILPWYYELVAWLTMVGPLFVVPFTCAYTIYEAYKRGKPMMSVISVHNWRHEPKEEEQRQPKHQVEDENDYMYIDPISRDPSTKIPRVFRGIDVNITDDENYSKIDERIREWAEKSAKSETGRTIELATIEEIEMQPSKRRDSTQSEFSYGGRIKGRLRDWTLSNDTEQSSKKEEEVPATPSYVEDFRTPSLGSKSSDDINLFGPPPVLEGFENSRADTIKYRSSKHRLARRSDQKKSRMFDDAFNFELATAVIIEQPAPSPQSVTSEDQRSIGERLGTIRKRLSSESMADHQSVGSLSITPIDCSYYRSMSSISEPPQQFLKPEAPQPLRLKRPKPIDNPPGSSKRSNASQ